MKLICAQSTTIEIPSETRYFVIAACRRWMFVTETLKRYSINSQTEYQIYPTVSSRLHLCMVWWKRPKCLRRSLLSSMVTKRQRDNIVKFKSRPTNNVITFIATSLKERIRAVFIKRIKCRIIEIESMEKNPNWKNK